MNNKKRTTNWPILHLKPWKRCSPLTEASSITHHQCSVQRAAHCLDPFRGLCRMRTNLPVPSEQPTAAPRGNGPWPHKTDTLLSAVLGHSYFLVNIWEWGDRKASEGKEPRCKTRKGERKLSFLKWRNSEMESAEGQLFHDPIFY